MTRFKYLTFLMPENGLTHTLGNFENALKAARNNVLTMASIAQQNLEYAIRGLLTRNPELCNEAIAEDDEVNAYERVIDREGFEILMRFNPVAGDLREVLAGMKVANNLERVSDQAESIARRSRKVLKSAEVPEIQQIEALYEMAISLLKDAIRTFSEGDMELGISLFERDQELDKAHRKLIKELTKAIEREPSAVKTYLHLIFIVRCLERVGDHAVNIAEDAIFAEKAADVRHLRLEEAAEKAGVAPPSSTTES
ncbi:MAG: phosphate signaling complex protein PhoU [Verrucomicrobiae bacterium]|nr:phosphate signaling complex protein PhoU [Verrucomicrobiae bacterium]